ncbi:MAG: response regulator transcription factor [Marinomonas sp.]
MIGHETTKVVVLDDHPLFRRGLVELLNSHPDFQVMADYDDGFEFLKSPYPTQIDLLLLDLHMPKISGIDTLKKVRVLQNQLKVVIITASEDSSELFEAITLGANGYLLKDSSPDAILSQLGTVLQGDIAIDATGVTMLAKHISEGNNISAHVSHEDDAFELTEREKQTLQLITQGMSNKLIARELGISDGTVKVYVKNLLRKLNLGSRLELAAWAHASHNFQSE